MSRDFLVIYEGDENEDDSAFTVDVTRGRRQRLGALEVQHAMDVGLQNSSSRLGLIGFMTTVFGAVVAAVAMAMFANGFPGEWYGGNAGLVRSIIVTAFSAITLLVAGTMMTHYGRRIQAHGKLRGIRIVEKAPRTGIQ